MIIKNTNKYNNKNSNNSNFIISNSSEWGTLILAWFPMLNWNMTPVGAQVRFLSEPAAKEDHPDRKPTLIPHDEYK